MSNIRFSLFNRGQNPLGDDMHARFQEACEQARLADKLGFDTLMKGSHYSAYPLLDFQQVPFLSRIMAEAPNLRLCAGIVLLPLHKPLDVAETFANIDVMSGGKLILALAWATEKLSFRPSARR